MAEAKKKPGRNRSKIVSIDTAIRIYYTYPELTGKEMNELFGKLAPSTITRYKKEVQAVQVEKDIKTSLASSIDTRVAYEVWGLNIEDLERRRAKLLKLGFQTA